MHHIRRHSVAFRRDSPILFRKKLPARRYRHAGKNRRGDPGLTEKKDCQKQSDALHSSTIIGSMTQKDPPGFIIFHRVPHAAGTDPLRGDALCREAGCSFSSFSVVLLLFSPAHPERGNSSTPPPRWCSSRVSTTARPATGGWRTGRSHA